MSIALLMAVRVRASRPMSVQGTTKMMQTYRPTAGVSYRSSARPQLMMKHIDGPLLTFRDGQMHWLTFWESVRVRLGWDTAESLERKHRPDLFRYGTPP